jgi:glyoxylase-like metal-dependent hydrolase (beta-lactamase superfamily II)
VRIEVIHTPGHMSNHICLALGDTLLSGDHVMAWSTSLVSPPDGDMGAYMASLHKLAKRTWRRFLPGHGEAVEDPAARLEALIAHRVGREASVLAALAQGPATASALTKTIYTDLAPTLHGAAMRNVLAHLIDLQSRGKVARTGTGPLSVAAFQLA